MANIKKLTLDWSETNKVLYCIVRREADNYLLNDADGNFANAPADPYVSLTEHTVIKGRYEKSESRQVWNDGLYTIAVYKQSGGSPAPANDTIVGTGDLYIISDTESTTISAVNSALDSSIAELSTVPAATPSIRQALMLLFMALRNEENTTATQLIIKNNAGTTVATATLSDDGTTFIKSKLS